MLLIKPTSSPAEMKAEEIRNAKIEMMNAQADYTAILTDTLLINEGEGVNEQDI